MLMFGSGVNDITVKLGGFMSLLSKYSAEVNKIDLFYCPLPIQGILRSIRYRKHDSSAALFSGSR